VIALKITDLSPHQRGRSTIVFTKYNLNYKVEEDEVGRTCGMNGGEEERVQVIGRKTRGKETTRKIET
jgi:hypothetical protein